MVKYADIGEIFVLAASVGWIMVEAFEDIKPSSNPLVYHLLKILISLAVTKAVFAGSLVFGSYAELGYARIKATLFELLLETAGLIFYVMSVPLWVWLCWQAGVTGFLIWFFTQEADGCSYAPSFMALKSPQQKACLVAIGVACSAMSAAIVEHGLVTGLSVFCAWTIVGTLVAVGGMSLAKGLRGKGAFGGWADFKWIETVWVNCVICAAINNWTGVIASKEFEQRVPEIVGLNVFLFAGITTLTFFDYVLLKKDK